MDDILDVEESSEALGKTAGKDAQQHKITFPAVYGLENRAHGGEGMRAARTQALEPFGDRARAPARTGRPDRPPQVMKTRGCDRLLVERGLAESREKAQALIMAGEVLRQRAEGRQARPAVAARCPSRCSRGRPTSAAAASSWQAALEHFAHRRRRQRLPRRRLVHRRLHRCACCSAARRACTPWMSARASSIGSCAPIRAWSLHEGINARDLTLRRDRRAGGPRSSAT